ncbi:hypothetical protein TNCV_1126361 [Trichonephila clavipes]|nr:hypothetical protein TNCV_1126361 [Trichonephila clavipes]
MLHQLLQKLDYIQGREPRLCCWCQWLAMVYYDLLECYGTINSWCYMVSTAERIQQGPRNSEPRSSEDDHLSCPTPTPNCYTTPNGGFTSLDRFNVYQSLYTAGRRFRNHDNAVRGFVTVNTGLLRPRAVTTRLPNNDQSTLNIFGK